MSDLADRVLDWLQPCLCDACHDARMRAAFADSPVADTAEPLTAEAGRTVTEPDGDDGYAVSH